MASMGGELEFGYQIEGATDGTSIGNTLDALRVILRNTAGNEAGTVAAPIRIDPTGTTPQPSSQSGTWNTGRTWVLGSGTDSVAAVQSGTWNINNITGTVSLPTGASTLAAQTTINNTLTTLSAKFGPIGQNNMANSAPVVIANNQSAIPVSQSGTWTAGRTWTLAFGTDSVTSRTQDGSGNAIGSVNSELQARDICNGGGAQGAITVGTSAVLAAANGASNLANRKSITVYNNGTVFVYFGHTNAVTTSTGIPLVPGTMAIFAVGPTTNVYLISGSANQNVRITEMA